MSGSPRFLRQIHPRWWQEDGATPSKLAFLPSPKDNDLLSGYDGQKISPAESYRHYVYELNLLSDAVYGLSEEECKNFDHEILESPRENNPHHVHLDFSSIKSRSQKEKRAKKLRDMAAQRGILFRPTENA